MVGDSAIDAAAEDRRSEIADLIFFWDVAVLLSEAAYVDVGGILLGTDRSGGGSLIDCIRSVNAPTLLGTMTANAATTREI